MTKLSDMIDANMLGEPKRFLNLTMFPLAGDASKTVDYLVLDEAAAYDYVRISEISEGGSVPELRVQNNGPKSVLLLDGEQLVGAKQNRVLNLTVLAPAGKAIDIPVSCVEAGRWAYESPAFMASERTHFAQGRARKAAAVSASMASGRGRYSDQGEVWDGIAAKAMRMDSTSPTGAMEFLYERHDASIEKFLAALAPVDGQAGAVFAIGARIVGMDLFDHPTTFGKLFRKLLSGYAVDALEVGNHEYYADFESARQFLHRVAAGAPTSYPAVGLGTDLRYHDEHLTVAALVRDDGPVHVCAFSMGDIGDDEVSVDFSRASARARRRGRSS